MQFSEILGQEHIKNHLTRSANLGRIPHAQLFVGPEGSGTLGHGNCLCTIHYLQQSKWRK